VNEVTLRMEMYQRFGEAVSIEDIELLWAELQDRYGPPPKPAEWLYYLARIRIHAAQRGYTWLKLEKVSLHLEQQKGKETVKRKVLISSPKSPQELENKILKIL
jgi:transcription-repair coupling factor (superfamily II helicase)